MNGGCRESAGVKVEREQSSLCIGTSFVRAKGAVLLAVGSGTCCGSGTPSKLWDDGIRQREHKS